MTVPPRIRPPEISILLRWLHGCPENGVRVLQADFGGVWWWEGDLSTGIGGRYCR